ncbi:MAG: CPBP family intramembrane metalloprotease [Candidatus Lokiarchaeota archaeon]|nr:CPBP family intramembrane metalloprotease [Candidatus Lokiarchaeota archaeon]
MGRLESPLQTILKQRFYFLFEVLIIFIGIFLFMLIPSFLLPFLIDSKSVIFEPLYYLLRAVILIATIPLFLYLATLVMEKQRKKLILKEDISPSRNFLSLFKITKKNFKFQLLYGVLLLFLVFIPLDFFTYFFSPDMLSYTSVVLDPAGEFSLNSYFNENYSIFLFSIIIIPLCVAVYEESLVRGFFTNRGSDYFNEMSAVIITSFFFGLGHFAYVFGGPSLGLPIIFPIIWFLQTFFVGIILAMVVLRKHWIFPAIFAHTLNNVISSHSIWNYINGQNFSVMTIFIYIPLLVIGIILFIWQFSRIKESLSIGFKEFKTYFERDKTIEESSSDAIIRILLDFLFGLIIFLIGLATVY